MRRSLVVSTVLSLAFAVAIPSLQAVAKPASRPVPLDAPMKVVPTSEQAFKQLVKARQYTEAMALARNVYPTTVTKKRRKAWNKRFKKARKAAVKTVLKQAKVAYKKVDYPNAVQLSHAADRHFLLELPWVEPLGKAKKKKKRKIKRLPGEKLRKAIAKKLMKPVKKHMKKGDFVAAYAATAPIVQLFGANDPRSGGVIATIRASIFKAVDGHVAQKRWNQAYDLLNLVAKTEPKRATEVKTRRELVTVQAELAAGADQKAMERARGTYEATRQPELKGRARALFLQAQKTSINRIMASANAELRAARYKRAVELASDADGLWAVRLSGPQQQNQGARPGAGIRTAARNQLLSPARNALKKGQFEAAYVAVASFFDVFPNDAEGQSVRGSIRATIYARSDGFMQQGDFKSARRILNIVERYEPNRAGEVQRRKQGIKVARAEALDRHSAGAEANGDFLGAWALARRSFALGFAPADQRVRRMRRKLARRGRVNVNVVGYGKRATKHTDAVINRVAQLPGVAARPRGANATLSVTVNAPWPRCYENANVRYENRGYNVYRKVANPNWPQADRRVRDLRQQKKRAQADLAKTKKALNVWLNRLTQCATREGAAKGRLKRATDDQAEVKRRFDRVSKNLKQAKKKLKKAQAAKKAGKNKDAVITALTMEIGRLEQRKIKLGNKLNKANKELAAAKKALNQASTECARVRSEQQRLRNVNTNAQNRLMRVNNDLRKAERRLQKTPRFNQVADRRTVSMQITRVRRTCRAIVDVTVQPPRGASWAQRLERSRFTEDDTHPAYPVAKIAANPLRFPANDRGMVREADRQMRNQVVGVVERSVSSWYSRKLTHAEKAARRGDMQRAATIWMTMWLATPERLPAAAKQRLSDHLARTYKLRRPLR